MDGVFAMSDPMGVVSNIGFIDKSGANLPDFMAAVQLNQITYALPWQAEVAEATRRVRAGQPWSERVRASRARARALDTHLATPRSTRQAWRTTS
jgi:hypothetical protein